MDFGALLHTAQRNKKVAKKEGVRCYSTKFEPPKKEQRNKQQLSANIKKFLARKEAEEKEKLMEAHKKRDDLLALRAKDKKATRRVNVMLKRTKSANQSVLEDAVDCNNTSVTLAGPMQPDEDDYGYVSQEASAYYNKMMEKYSRMPEEPKFDLNKKKKVSTDLNSTKERVKAALEREQEEAHGPHKRKRKHKEEAVKEEVVEEREVQQQEEPPKVKQKVAAPPPLNFNDLLKLAAKKQFEPIVIEQKPKEEEKLLTKKQKKEMERVKEWRDRKEGRLPPLEKPTVVADDKAPKLVEKNQKVNLKMEPPKKIDLIRKTPDNVNRKIQEVGKKVNFSKAPIVSSQSARPRDLYDGKRKNSVPKVAEKSSELPKRDLKPKQLPPLDVQRKEFPSKDVKRKQPQMNKRRILDDDYDSEMDDFIDDGPGEGEDYSKYISEIFGYDKSKYRQTDDDVDNMESSFAQQMKEEVISTKIGIMEDLEDMRMEEEEKRRKAVIKKRN